MESQSFPWRQAGRAKTWQLGAVNLMPFWLLQLSTVIALFGLVRELLKLAMSFTNVLLVNLPYVEPFQAFYRDPTWFILVTLGILLSLSPWLVDRLLQLDGFQPLSITTLSTYSPEAARVILRYCRQQGWSYPTLGILPTSAPVAMTYGNLPRNARILVSQGLLERLADDEIATVYASCLGQIAHWDFVVMSLFMVIQLPYIIYRQLSQWGDWLEDKRKEAYNSARAERYLYLLRFCFLCVGLVATIAYGVWYLLERSAMWLSQVRIYYSDRRAVEITGNPNGLTRALVKIAQGIAKNIEQQEHTSWLLESFNIFTLVGYRQSITLGSLHSSTQLESMLAWECINPYRHWLTINNTHPLMGDRLQRLAQIAHHWHLETELNLPSPLPLTSTERVAHTTFLLQGAPYLGIALGFIFGCLIWLLGGFGILIGIDQLGWMYGDWVIIKGCLPIGFSIGTLMRINSFFPDITSILKIDASVLRTAYCKTFQPEEGSHPANLIGWSNLPQLLSNPNALPILSQPVHLQGKLVGRCGISNWLGQDLILHSPNCLIKLHHVSPLKLGNLSPIQLTHPGNFLGEQIVLTGWFRRGATPWIDIEALHLLSETSYSDHPMWSTLLAVATAAWGVYVILWSNF